MKLNSVKPNPGAIKAKKRVGRGPGSGTGKTAGRGENGQNSRSGGGVRIGFEGGQTPLFRRLPKRGFTNARFKKVYAVINLDDLNRFEDGADVSPEILKDMGLIKNMQDGLKVLGNGKLEKKLNIKANKFSKTAIKEIEKLGGKAEVI
ncbi:MAG: 50S ribosomal protein L15 [Bacilli bacterium]|nr:50S ribosomal protein L15 [Bacilli bacterium]